MMDMRTVLIVVGCLEISLVGAMYYVVLHRKVYPGFQNWCLAFALRGFGVVLLACRGILPDLLTIPLANALVLAGSMVLLYGVRKFFGRPNRYTGDMLLLAALFLAFVYFGLIAKDLRIRIILISLSTIFYQAWAAGICLQEFKKDKEIKNILILIALFTMISIVMLRAVLSWSEPFAGNDYLGSYFVHIAAILLNGLGDTLLMAGLITINQQRLEKEWHKAQREVCELKGIIPICASCKKIRDDKGYWSQVETYFRAHSEAEFSHSICPDCAKRLYPDIYEQVWEDGGKPGE